MLVLNFQARFADDVEAGRKPCSIRNASDRALALRKGSELRLYTGQRTKGCRWLADARVTKVEWIRIRTAGIERRGKTLSPRAARRLAKREGFADLEDMLTWFRTVHGLPFTGLLISWRLIRGCHQPPPPSLVLEHAPDW